jgi:hypothetical protein
VLLGSRNCFVIVVTTREADEQPTGVADGHVDDTVDNGVIVERLHPGGVASRRVFRIDAAGIEVLPAEERRHLRVDA